MRRFFYVAILGGFVAACNGQAVAADKPDIDGIYAGSFLCGNGEMGMSLSLKVGKKNDQLCRSGAGPCNDKYDNSWTLKGLLNFYPTLGNPGAPAGAFWVEGTTKAVGGTLTHIDLSPRDWIVQPENFGASALEARIVKGKVFGKPLAEGCHTLRLQKLAEPGS